jgi:hypothetical protein
MSTLILIYNTFEKDVFALKPEEEARKKIDGFFKYSKKQAQEEAKHTIYNGPTSTSQLEQYE